ncbi:olfactory receptor 14I1-like [Macrotis lagotis]|uniref:olfactory receptor 14I1-like n=1 Tax=Macrotis lagotis TaxID=92651 RepID=UPI003D699FCB
MDLMQNRSTATLGKHKAGYLLVQQLDPSNQCPKASCCASQIFFVLGFGTAEFALLVAVSYDCYVAICHPLHYGIIMSPVHCILAAVGSWLSGLVYSAVHTGNMFWLPFYGSNVIHQFFCDISHVLNVLTSDVFHTVSINCTDYHLISKMIVVLKDTLDTSPIQNLLIAMIYTVLPPYMNPIIYSLRNQKVTVAMAKMIRRMFTTSLKK